MQIEYDMVEGVVLIHFRGERYRIVRKFNKLQRCHRRW